MAKRFGTFEGVFTPTFLSILGIIMYLRLGWVVGMVGLKGALIIIVVSNLITLFTCLSISSITTNMRIGAGGAYTMISKSLGLEVGGAIGIPLYLSQALSVAFYVAGFTECWISLFPAHSFLMVSILAWFCILLISYFSAKLAFKIQYVIIGIIIASLFSFFLGKTSPAHTTLVWEGMAKGNLWLVFAIFFPAVTGILAGVSMSGELNDAERSIPIGTLSAVSITFIIYILVAIRFAYVASAGELVQDTTFIVILGRWKPLIYAGIMGATLSSALSMFVASPRTLLALGRHGMVPFSSYFSRLNTRQEPATAIIFTAMLSLITLLMGTLNTIAVLLTMIFLITYGMLNITVFIERIIGIISFRPTFRVPSIFSFLGGVGCLWAMFLINSFYSVIGIILIVGIYFILIRIEIKRSWPDIRKGVFIFVAEQAVKIAAKLPYHPKIWKPNLLIPIEEPTNWTDLIVFLRAITFPSGRIQLLRIIERGTLSLEKESEHKDLKLKFDRERIEDEFSIVTSLLKNDGILISPIIVDSSEFLEGVHVAAQTLKSSFFPPNVLFLKMGKTSKEDTKLKRLIKEVAAHDLAIMVLYLLEGHDISNTKRVNVWLREGSPNINLALLATLQLKRNMSVDIQLVRSVQGEQDTKKQYEYLFKLRRLMRLPRDTQAYVLKGSFYESLQKAPVADLNVLGMPEKIDLARQREVAEKLNSCVLFLRDSTQESAIV